MTHLAEEFPDVAAYLQSVGSAAPNTNAPSGGHAQPSQYSENVASEQLTSTLVERAREILQRAEAEGRDPEEELRQVVGETVLQGVLTGYDLGAQVEESEQNHADADGAEAKRPRTDEGSG